MPLTSRKYFCGPAVLAVAIELALTGCRPPAPAPALPTPEQTPDAKAAEPLRTTKGKTLLMHYMPWYETPVVSGQWGSHWKGPKSEHNPDQTGSDGLPDIYSHYHPLIGLYDSKDPDVLECQLLQMKLAGIDGVIVDWYGISNAVDYPGIHKATKAIFEAAGEAGMKFAACYEDRSIELQVNREILQPDRVTEHLTETVKWMNDEWFSKPQYFRLNDRPLLLNFGPMYVKDASTWEAALSSVEDRPAFYALHHLWKDAGGDGGFTWVHWEPWTGYPEEAKVKRRLHGTFSHLTETPDQLIVSAYPGFNDVYEQSHRELNHRDGQTLKESLAVAMEGPWPVVQLVTWNDYGEGTIIEPTVEFGYKFLEIIQDARRAELGADFAFTAEDLRLPAQLLELRRQNRAPKTSLDQVAAFLAAGRVTEARALLFSIGGH